MFSLSRQSRTPARTRCSPSHQETGTSHRSWPIMRTASWCETTQDKCEIFSFLSLTRLMSGFLCADISWAQRTVQSGDICTGNVFFYSWHQDISSKLKLSLPCRRSADTFGSFNRRCLSCALSDSCGYVSGSFSHNMSYFLLSCKGLETGICSKRWRAVVQNSFLFLLQVQISHLSPCTKPRGTQKARQKTERVSVCISKTVLPSMTLCRSGGDVLGFQWHCRTTTCAVGRSPVITLLLTMMSSLNYARPNSHISIQSFDRYIGLCFHRDRVLALIHTFIPRCLRSPQTGEQQEPEADPGGFADAHGGV